MLNRKSLICSVAAMALLTGCANGDLKTARRAQQAGDLETARANYEELAEYGVPEAQLEMASITLKSHPDPAQMQAALAKLDAASQSDASISMRLGDIYEEGKVVPRNLKLAYKYYSQAFDLGLTKASYKIGTTLAETPSNNELAKAWLEKSLAAGEDKAAFKLGRLYEKGYIRDASPVKALGYYMYAQTLGIDIGDSIKKLKPKMSATQIHDGELFSQQLASGV